MEDIKVIGRGTLTNAMTNVDDEAVPAGHKRAIKAITLCNKTDSDVWVTVQLHGTNILHRYTVPGYGDREENTRTIPFLDQVMNEGERVTARADISSAIDYYISGEEQDVS